MTLDKRSFMLGLLGSNISVRLSNAGLLSDDSFLGTMKHLLVNRMNEQMITPEEFEIISLWSTEIMSKLDPRVRAIIDQDMQPKDQFYTQ